MGTTYPRHSESATLFLFCGKKCDALPLPRIVKCNSLGKGGRKWQFTIARGKSSTKA